MNRIAQADDIVRRNQHIFGPWERTGREVRLVKVPTIVSGLSATVVTSERLYIEANHERRKVWKFIGYEERTTES